VKRTAGKRVTPMKNMVKKKMAKKSSSTKGGGETRAVGKKTIGGKTMAAPKKQVRRKSQGVDSVAFSQEGPVSRSSGQSGDLQGLSNAEVADSESVDELLEEGNAFQADVVMGVEDAGDAEGREVRTHEVLEDDIPGEYLDKEQ
jgi:hypothetical protein